MDLNKISYAELLQHIDHLRENGVSDNHPNMIKAKWKLREFLDSTGKTSKGVVPKLKSIKTLALTEQKSSSYNKYALLGIILGIGALVVRRLTATDSPSN